MKSKVNKELIDLVEAFDEMLIEVMKKEIIINKDIEWLFKNGYEENEYISSFDSKLWIKSDPEELYNILVGYEEDE